MMCCTGCMFMLYLDELIVHLCLFQDVWDVRDSQLHILTMMAS